jgi:hypothetical protein
VVAAVAAVVAAAVDSMWLRRGSATAVLVRVAPPAPLLLLAAPVLPLAAASLATPSAPSQLPSPPAPPVMAATAVVAVVAAAVVAVVAAVIVTGIAWPRVACKRLRCSRHAHHMHCSQCLSTAPWLCLCVACPPWCALARVSWW